MLDDEPSEPMRQSAQPDDDFDLEFADLGYVLVSGEVAIAGKGGVEKEIVSEVADLWFHTLVMLSHLDLDACAVLECLEDRFGVSGIDEKASRDAGNK